MKRRTPRVKKRGKDNQLLILTLVLTFLGLVAVADASAPQALAQFGDKFYFLKQQGVWALGGVALMFVISFIKPKLWEAIATPFFFFTLILLVVVLIPGVSLKALGARRWISLPHFNFQPSELIKLSLSLYFAKLVKSEKGPASFFIPLVVVLGLIMLEPDLGTTMVVAFIGVTQIFVSGINLIHFFGAGVIGILSVIGLILASPYRRDRLLTFLKVTEDPLGKGYHIRQVLLAVGSGGLFGLGIGASRQKFLFLPEAATDSIFAIIAEELGFVGAVFLICLICFFLYKCFKIAVNSKDVFNKILALGLTAWICGQTFLNIASMVALIPLTGIPLPFFSYGGSSLIMILVSCGILLSIQRYESA